MPPQQLELCAGIYSDNAPIAECKNCLRFVQKLNHMNNHWIAPPDFDHRCPEKKEKAK